MNDISNYSIRDHLPGSINRDETRNIAGVIDEQLQKLTTLASLIEIYPNIDHLPEDVIDELAVQFHMDIYDESMSLATKRDIVKNAIPWHMRLGTPSMLREFVATVFQSAKVEEWFEYGGRPYYFRVSQIREPMRPESVKKVMQAINFAKNVRSWLEGMAFLNEGTAAIHVGAVGSMAWHYNYSASFKEAHRGVIHMGGVGSMYFQRKGE